MTKELLRAKANDIETMNEDELFDFGVSIGASYLDAKSKWYLLNKIDERKLELRGLADIQGENVVMSEIKEGDL